MYAYLLSFSISLRLVLKVIINYTIKSYFYGWGINYNYY